MSQARSPLIWLKPIVITAHEPVGLEMDEVPQPTKTYGFADPHDAYKLHGEGV